MGNLGQAKKGESVVDANKAITAAGTPEQLSTDHKFCDWIQLQLAFGNTGAKGVVGFSNAVDIATNVGVVLGKGNTVTYEGIYLDEIWLDVDTNGDQFAVQYKEKRKVG